MCSPKGALACKRNKGILPATQSFQAKKPRRVPPSFPLRGTRYHPNAAQRTLQVLLSRGAFRSGIAAGEINSMEHVDMLAA